MNRLPDSSMVISINAPVKYMSGGEQLNLPQFNLADQSYRNIVSLIFGIPRAKLILEEAISIGTARTFGI